jgi:hypothetical protein
MLRTWASENSGTCGQQFHAGIATCYRCVGCLLYAMCITLSLGDVMMLLYRNKTGHVHAKDSHGGRQELPWAVFIANADMKAFYRIRRQLPINTINNINFKNELKVEFNK